ncbi:MAG: hypothetical protein Fur0039_05810 [Rhodocyclaceae bacterium]
MAASLSTFRRAPRTNAHRLKPLALALAASLGLTAAPPALPITVDWTGNAPVYKASWYNGFYTEFHEFQYFLDWLGFCDAHFGASCGAGTYWGSSGNWSPVGPPTAVDDVVTPAGSEVRISSTFSTYQGPISGIAHAGSLSAQGKLVITEGTLYTNSAAIADLGLGSNGVFHNDGAAFVSVLSAGSGRLEGSGSTQVGSMASAFFQPVVGSGHTLTVTSYAPAIYGSSPYYSGFSPSLEADAHLISNGNLDVGGGRVWLSGAANALTLPRFTNNGSLGVFDHFDISGVRFDNAGTVALGENTVTGLFGRLWANNGGTHSGSFTGVAGSEMTFTGFAGTGHVFQPGSVVASDGRVVFEKSGHHVSGSYRAAETEFRNAAAVTFDGSLSFLDRVIGSDGFARFSTAAGADIGELVINPGFVALFNTGAPSQIGTVTLNGGSLGGSQAVNISGPLNWNGGGVTGTVHANGGIEMGAGTRTLGGVLHNHGTANWNDGSFTYWDGVFDNPAGALLDLKGDFRAGYDLSTIPGGGAFAGRFDNAGTFRKSAGAGTANLDMAFDNGGQVEALSGTLLLRGGGTQTGSFGAAPGARIELMGDTVIAGPVTTSGRVDVTGHYWRDHTLTLAGGGSYTNAAGNTIGTINVDIQAGGSLANQGVMSLYASQPRNFNNAGTFTNAGSVVIYGSFANGGAVTNAAAGVLDLWGTGNGNGGSIVNTGTFNFGAFANTGSIVNTGTATSGDFEHQAGSIVNAGNWTSRGNFSVFAGASFDNPGSLSHDGDVFHILNGAAVTGTGSYTQFSGTTWVQGLLAAGGGIDIQSGLLKGTGTLDGPVTLGPSARWAPGDSPGTMTVNGDVSIDGDAFLSPGGGNLEIEFAGAGVFDRIVASGDVTVNDATVDLVFLPGFTALDGEGFQWLSAANVYANGFVQAHVSGLDPDFDAQVGFDATGGWVELFDTQALQLPLSGDYIVCNTCRASNADGQSAWRDALQVEGSLSNRRLAVLNADNLQVLAGGTLMNRGQLLVAWDGANAGTLLNRPGGALSVGQFSNSGLLRNEGNLTNDGTLTNLAGGRIENAGVMNANGQIVNRGEFVVSGTLDNQASTLGPIYGTGSVLNHQGGVFTVEAGGMVSGPGTYFQEGYDSVTRVNGTLAASDITIWQGVLTGGGTLVGPVTLGSSFGMGATVRPGNSPGTLTVDGDLTAYNTTFDIELAGPALFDRLVVTGNAQFSGGRVNVVLHTPDGITYDYRPAAGDSFTWLSVGGATAGLDSLGWSLEVVGDGWTSTVASSDWGSTQWVWGPAASDGVQIAFYGDRVAFTTLAPVPEPQTWAMLLAGLGLVGWVARRRRSI